jgi:hypothetical protein
VPCCSAAYLLVLSPTGLQSLHGLLPPASKGPLCAVSLPNSYGFIVDVKLSSDCPSHSNGCSGPADGLPNMELLTPCCHAHGESNMFEVCLLGWRCSSRQLTAAGGSWLLLSTLPLTPWCSSAAPAAAASHFRQAEPIKEQQMTQTHLIDCCCCRLVLHMWLHERALRHRRPPHMRPPDAAKPDRCVQSNVP